MYTRRCGIRPSFDHVDRLLSPASGVLITAELQLCREMTARW